MEEGLVRPQRRERVARRLRLPNVGVERLHDGHVVDGDAGRERLGAARRRHPLGERAGRRLGLGRRPVFAERVAAGQDRQLEPCDAGLDRVDGARRGPGVGSVREGGEPLAERVREGVGHEGVAPGGRVEVVRKERRALDPARAGGAEAAGHVDERHVVVRGGEAADDLVHGLGRAEPEPVGLLGLDEGGARSDRVAPGAERGPAGERVGGGRVVAEGRLVAQVRRQRGEEDRDAGRPERLDGVAEVGLVLADARAERVALLVDGRVLDDARHHRPRLRLGLAPDQAGEAGPERRPRRPDQEPLRRDRRRAAPALGAARPIRAVELVLPGVDHDGVRLAGRDGGRERPQRVAVRRRHAEVGDLDGAAGEHGRQPVLQAGGEAVVEVVGEAGRRRAAEGEHAERARRGLGRDRVERDAGLEAAEKLGAEPGREGDV